jgi:hypothetical protein
VWYTRSVREAHRAVRCRHRLGWLLRVNRLFATQSRHARLRNFAAEFSRDGSVATTVGTFSRWETGMSTTPYRAVRRYERVLGLPDYSLVTVIDTISRYMSPSAGPAPLLMRPEQPDAEQRIEEFVDRARVSDLMTAHDWDELTNLLAREPAVILSPRKVWAELSERLLYETAIADGTLWMHRAEAFNRLIAHPAGQHAAISTVANAAADRSMQSMVGTVSVFEASTHDSANLHVVRHLTDPVTDRTFSGALLASVRKLRYGHFTASQLRRLVPVIVDILADGHGGSRLALAASLLKMIPVAMRQRVNDRIWQVVTQGLERTATSTGLAGRVHDATITNLDHPGSGYRDSVLPHLIDELLCDPIFDVRLYAAFLLYATPYRAPLGRALGQELLTARQSGNAQRLVTLLEALRILGGPEERRHVERLLLAPSTPSGIRDTAASALGHIGGASQDDYWTLALRTARQRWRQSPTVAEISVLDRHVYALGMADRRALLRTVTADPTLPDQVRSAASWWLTLPSHIRESARI